MLLDKELPRFAGEEHAEYDVIYYFIIIYLKASASPGQVPS